MSGIFADIRTIAAHQVLAYTDSTDDGCFLHVMFRINGGTQVNMKHIFKDEDQMWKAFRMFTAGKHDDALVLTINECERNFIASQDEN